MSSTGLNRDFYDAGLPGVEDYWRYMAAPRARVARILALLRRIAPSSIADLGCGNGALLAEIAAAMPSVALAGIDLSSRQIESNRRRFPSIDWQLADLQTPLTTGRRYAAVVASEVIEHLDDPAMLLANARTLAERGGHLVLTTQSGAVRPTERRVGHVRHFSAAEMRTLLERSGWTPVSVWNEGWPFHDLSKWYANRDPERSIEAYANRPYGRRERLIAFALRAAFRCNSRTRGAQLFAVARNLE